MAKKLSAPQVKALVNASAPAPASPPVFTRQTPASTLVDFHGDGSRNETIRLGEYSCATTIDNGEERLHFDAVRVRDGVGLSFSVNASGTSAALSPCLYGRRIARRTGSAAIPPAPLTLPLPLPPAAPAPVASTYAEACATPGPRPSLRPCVNGDTGADGWLAHAPDGARVGWYASRAEAVEALGRAGWLVEPDASARKPPLWQSALDEAYARGHVDGSAEVCDARARARSIDGVPPGSIILPPHAATLPAFAELADRVRLGGGVVKILRQDGGVSPMPAPAARDVFLHHHYGDGVVLSCGKNAWIVTVRDLAQEDWQEIAHGRDPHPLRCVRLTYGIAANYLRETIAVRCGETGTVYVVERGKPGEIADPFVVAERRARRAAELLAESESDRADLCAPLCDAVATLGRGRGWAGFVADFPGANDADVAARKSVLWSVKALADALEMRARRSLGFGGLS